MLYFQLLLLYNKSTSVITAIRTKKYRYNTIKKTDSLQWYTNIVVSFLSPLYENYSETNLYPDTS